MPKTYIYGIPICANCEYYKCHVFRTTDDLGHCSKYNKTVDGNDDSGLCPYFICNPPCLRKKEQPK